MDDPESGEALLSLPKLLSGNNLRLAGAAAAMCAARERGAGELPYGPVRDRLGADGVCFDV